jgi:hypothetical protein
MPCRRYDASLARRGELITERENLRVVTAAGSAVYVARNGRQIHFKVAVTVTDEHESLDHFSTRTTNLGDAAIGRNVVLRTRVLLVSIRLLNLFFLYPHLSSCVL